MPINYTFDEVIADKRWRGLPLETQQRISAGYFKAAYEDNPKWTTLSDEQRDFVRKEHERKFTASIQSGATEFGRQLTKGLARQVTSIPAVAEAASTIASNPKAQAFAPTVALPLVVSLFLARKALPSTEKIGKYQRELEYKYPTRDRGAASFTGQVAAGALPSAIAVGAAVAAAPFTGGVSAAAIPSLLTYTFLTSTGQSLIDQKVKQAKLGTTTSDERMAIRALGSGTVAAASEFLFSGLQVKAIKELSAPMLHQIYRAAKAADKTKVTRLLYQGLKVSGEEGSEELVNQLADNWIGFLATPELTQDISWTTGLKESFWGGALGGVGVGITGIGAHLATKPAVRQRVAKAHLAVVDFVNKNPSASEVEIGSFAQQHMGALKIDIKETGRRYREEVSKQQLLQQMKEAKFEEPEQSVVAAKTASPLEEFGDVPIVEEEEAVETTELPVETIEQKVVGGETAPTITTPVAEKKISKKEVEKERKRVEREIAKEAKRVETETLLDNAYETSKAMLNEGKTVNKLSIYKLVRPDSEAKFKYGDPLVDRVYSRLESEGLLKKKGKVSGTETKKEAPHAVETQRISFDVGGPTKPLSQEEKEATIKTLIAAEYGFNKEGKRAKITGSVAAKLAEEGIISKSAAATLQSAWKSVKQTEKSEARPRLVEGILKAAGVSLADLEPATVPSTQQVIETPVVPPAKAVKQGKTKTKEKAAEAAQVAEVTEQAPPLPVALEDPSKVGSSFMRQLKLDPNVIEPIRKRLRSLSQVDKAIDQEGAVVDDLSPREARVMRAAKVRDFLLKETDLNAAEVETVLKHPAYFLKKLPKPIREEGEDLTLAGGIIPLTPDVLKLLGDDAAKVYTFGVNLYRKGVTKFRAWASSMLREFDQKIRPVLRRIWNKIKEDEGSQNIGRIPQQTKLDRAAKVQLLSVMQSPVLDALAQGRGYETFREYVAAKADEKDEKTGKPKALSFGPTVWTELVYMYRKSKGQARDILNVLPKTFYQAAIGLQEGLEKELKRYIKSAPVKLRNLPYQDASISMDDIRYKYLTKLNFPTAGVKGFKTSMIPTKVLATLNFWLSDQRRTGILMHTQRVARTNDYIESYSSEIKPQKIEGKPAQEEKLGALGKIAASEEQATTRDLHESLLGIDSKSYVRTRDLVKKAIDKKLTVIQAVGEIMNDGLSDIALDLFMDKKNVKNYPLGEGRSINLAPVHKIGIYLALRDVTNSEAFFYGAKWGMPEESQTTEDAPALTHKEAIVIAKSLTQEELQAANTIYKATEVIRTFLRDYLKNLPPVEAFLLEEDINYRGATYFPRYLAAAGQELHSMTKIGDTWIINKGLPDSGGKRFLQEQKSKDQGLQIVDPFFVVKQLQDVVAAFVGTRDTSKLLWDVYTTDNKFTKEARNSKHGRITLQFLTKWVEHLNGSLKPLDVSKFTKAVSLGMKKISAGLISASPPAWFVQNLAYVSAALELEPKYIIYGMTHLDKEKREVLKERLEAEQPQMKERLHLDYFARAVSPEIQELINIKDALNWKEKITAAGMHPLKQRDTAIILSLYQGLLKKGEDLGWDPKKASDELVHLVNNTQATTSVAEETESMRSARQGDLTSQINMLFSYDIIKTHNLWRRSVRRFVESSRSPSDWRRFLYEQLISTIVMWMTYDIARSLGEFAVKLPGAIYQKRNMLDLVAEVSPLNPKKVIRTFFESPGTTVAGPIARYIFAPVEAMAQRINQHFSSAGNKGKFYPQIEDPVTGLLTQTIEAGEIGVDSFVAFFEWIGKDNEISKTNPKEVENKAIRALALASRLSAQFSGLPILPSRLILGGQSKDRAYYYDMYYQSIFHSNGKMRSDIDKDRQQYALKKLRELGATQESLEQAMGVRLGK